MDKHTIFANGIADVEASAVKYAEALTAWKAENELPTDQIAAAVSTVLGRSQSRVKMPTLLSLTVSEMGGDPSNFSSLSKQVHNYVKSEVAAGRLFAVRGPGGGIGSAPPAPKNA